METFYLTSAGGGQLHCLLWQPETQPKAVVQLIHGIAEHIGRYDAFARFLAAHGYVVAGDDHMGHGGSAAEGEQGFFRGGWLTAVEDEKRVRDALQERFPGLPHYMLGHSMGSFLLRTYLYTYPDALDRAVISGTGWEDPVKVKLGKLVCAAEEARVGEKKTSGLVTKLMFAITVRLRPFPRRMRGSARTTRSSRRMTPTRSAASTQQSALRAIC